MTGTWHSGTGTWHTYVLDADCQLCLKITEVLCKLVAVVVEGEKPLQKGQQLCWGKMNRTVNRDPQPLSEPLQHPGAEGLAGSPWEDALFLVSLSKPPELTPKPSLRFLPPKPRQVPAPGPLIPSVPPPPCIPEAPGSLGEETGGAGGRQEEEETARCRSQSCTSPNPKLLLAQQELSLQRAAEVWHFPEER